MKSFNYNNNVEYKIIRIIIVLFFLKFTNQRKYQRKLFYNAEV